MPTQTITTEQIKTALSGLSREQLLAVIAAAKDAMFAGAEKCADVQIETNLAVYGNSKGRN